jgi:hypothetical protein
MNDQLRQPLLAFLFLGGLIGRQPGAWPCSTWMGRPAGARSVTCCPQVAQSQRSGGT